MRYRSYRPGFGLGMGFGPPVTPPVIKQLLLANAAVFLLEVLFGAWTPLWANPWAFWREGHVWQPLTYMFSHGSFWHVAINMFMLWMFGSQLAFTWGPQRFLSFYLACGVGAGLLIVTFPWILYAFGMRNAVWVSTLGASGAVYGVLLAYSLAWPNHTIALIFPPVAFRAIWLIPIHFGLNVLSDMGSSAISHTGHFGGIAVGWLLLRARGETPRMSAERLKYQWRRFRMRRRLRAVQRDERRERNPWLH